MLFPEKPKSLPYLSDYLRYAATKRHVALPAPNFAGDLVTNIGLGLGVGWVTLMLSGAAGQAGAMFAGGCAFVIGLAGASRVAALSKRNKPLEEDERLEQESRAVVTKMHMLMNRRRLHRDLSPEVAVLLEEAATQWSRARAALLSPYWTRNDLSAHLQSVRDQCLRAIEKAMQELLVLFATSVPDQPGSWNLAEVVDEVVGKAVFANQPPRRISIFHDEALRMVRRLQEMAEEAERISRQLVTDPNLGVENRPGSSLEATLAELKSMRQAEDELRQDVQG